MSARTIDTNGWILIKNNPITKVGVFPYLGSSLSKDFIADKTYFVYRPAEELAKQEVLDSFKLLPWTNDHPEKLLGNKPNRLPTENEIIHGVTGENPVFDGDKITIDLKVFSQELADEIASGKIELSPGYTFKCEIKEGVYNGEKYDMIMREPRGNHMASVYQGRTGPEISVLDQSDQEVLMEPTQEEQKGFSLTDAKAKLEAIEAKFASLEEKLDKIAGAATSEVVAATDESTQKTTGCMDEDEEKDKKKEAAAMDGAEIRRAIYREMADKAALIREALPEIGVVDAADKDLQETAEYIAHKLGIQCKKEDTQIALKHFFAGKRARGQMVPAKAMDSAKSKQFTIESLLGRS